MANRRKSNRAKEKDTTWQERVIQIRRVSKVVKGGKKLSFRAIVVVGNERGQVGVGVGKASDVIGAVRKGVADGKKQLIDVPLTKSNSIPHPSNGTGCWCKSDDATRCAWNRCNCWRCCTYCVGISWGSQYFGKAVGF
jgi:small subunit ribosomal protein S5